MNDQIKIIQGNEINLNDVIGLLEELLQLHKEIDRDLKLAPNYLDTYRKTINIELKDKTSNYYLIAYEGQKPIAFGVGKKIFSPSMFHERIKGYIPYIYIKPSFRGKGLGKILINRLEQWFKEANIITIEINVMENNERALEFYIKEGFITMSKRLRKQIGD